MKSKINSISSRLFLFWMKYSRFIPSDILYIKVFYRLSMHQKLNLENPILYTEKIQWLKLKNTKPLFSKMVDKFESREIVSEKIGINYLIPLIGVWNSINEINFDELPDKFVLKTTHDSGSYIVCRNKSQLNYNEVKKKLSKALKRNYFYRSREYPYKHATPRIIAEKYMYDETQLELNDYKFYCFHGVPKFVQITTGKGKTKNSVYYDMDFKPLPFTTSNWENSPEKIRRPEKFQEMIDVSRKLSNGLTHIRIDLYYINNRIYFGEYTFHSSGGIIRFNPPEWNRIIGNWVMLDTIN